MSHAHCWNRVLSVLFCIFLFAVGMRLGNGGIIASLRVGLGDYGVLAG